MAVVEGTTSDSAVIEVNVEDAATGSFNFGAGYSTDSGLSANFSVKENNFLGRGQRLDFSVNYGEVSQSISFGFTEPAFLDRDVSLGSDVYYRNADRAESSYQTTSFGIEPKMTFPLNEDGRASIGYRLISQEIRDTTDTTSPIIKLEEGTEITSAINAGFTLDRRDAAFDPTSGYILRLSSEYAGLGGTTHYSKTTARAKGYLSLFGEALIVSADLEGGALFSLGGTGSRVIDRFFLGGQSFRGFSVGGIGPRDHNGLADDDPLLINDALGGNFYAVARIDATFPLGLASDLGIRGGFFLDAGSVWGMDGTPFGAGGFIDTSAQLRAATGVALYWDTPIGPLVFNWAYPLLTVAGDETQAFSVTVQTGF